MEIYIPLSKWVVKQKVIFMLRLVVKLYLQPVTARRTMCYSDSLLNHVTKIRFACKDVTFQGLKELFNRTSRHHNKPCYRASNPLEESVQVSCLSCLNIKVGACMKVQCQQGAVMTGEREMSVVHRVVSHLQDFQFV